jgi:hypothetical protein
MGIHRASTPAPASRCADRCCSRGHRGQRLLPGAACCRSSLFSSALLCRTDARGTSTTSRSSFVRPVSCAFCRHAFSARPHGRLLCSKQLVKRTVHTYSISTSLSFATVRSPARTDARGTSTAYVPCAHKSSGGLCTFTASLYPLHQVARTDARGTSAKYGLEEAITRANLFADAVRGHVCGNVMCMCVVWHAHTGGRGAQMAGALPAQACCRWSGPSFSLACSRSVRSRFASTAPQSCTGSAALRRCCCSHLVLHLSLTPAWC